LLNFVEHPAGKLRIAGGEGNNDGVRVLAEHPENELLERSPQRNSMVVASPTVRSLAFGFGLY
jgi:hypothetical protein